MLIFLWLMFRSPRTKLPVQGTEHKIGLWGTISALDPASGCPCCLSLTKPCCSPHSQPCCSPRSQPCCSPRSEACCWKVRTSYCQTPGDGWAAVDSADHCGEHRAGLPCTRSAESTLGKGICSYFLVLCGVCACVLVHVCSLWWWLQVIKYLVSLIWYNFRYLTLLNNGGNLS